MTIDNKFEIGDIVHYANEIGKDTGYVTGISIRPQGLLYLVTWSNKSETANYDFELLPAKK